MAMAKSTGGMGSDLHISDVIDVIEHDPEYVGSTRFAAMDTSNLRQVTSNIATLRNIEPSLMNSVQMGDPELEAKKRAFVKILEQPASKALRFRYECEGRSAGSIPGANSTTDSKTYPTIQVVGYRGRAVVVVSCVTKDPPYKPHPHSLVGKEGCKKGVCTLEINNENMICSFSNLGIQCVKKKGIEEALKLREEIRVDPFHTGFGHRNQPQSIDLNAVRLCFQVFLEGSQKGKFTFPLKPVVSDPIYDKKAMCDLTICKLSDCTSPATGGKEIILLCDKITKDDVQLRFYEERDGHVVWEGFGEFQASDVHRQVAICFRTPRYKHVEIETPVQTCIQLRRPSDGASSDPRPFQYLPLDSDTEMLKRKRLRMADTNNSRLEAYIQSNLLESSRLTHGTSLKAADPGAPGGHRIIKHGDRMRIKKEPLDVSSPEMMDVNMLPSYGLKDSQLRNSFGRNAMAGFPVNVSGAGVQFPGQFSYQPPTLNNIGLASNTPLTAEKPRNSALRGSTIMNLDSLNIEQQPGLDLGELPSINLPLCDGNVGLLDSHLLENFSLLDVDGNQTVDDSVKPLNTDPRVTDQFKDDPSRSKANQSSAGSALNFFSGMDLPVLTFSGMLSSADLEGSEQLNSATIKELESALQPKPTTQ